MIAYTTLDLYKNLIFQDRKIMHFIISMELDEKQVLDMIYTKIKKKQISANQSSEATSLSYFFPPPAIIELLTYDAVGYNNFFYAYTKYLEINLNLLNILSLVLHQNISKRDIVFLCSENELKKIRHLEVIAKFIQHRYDLRVLTPQELINIDQCQLDINEYKNYESKIESIHLDFQSTREKIEEFINVCEEYPDYKRTIENIKEVCCEKCNNLIIKEYNYKDIPYFHDRPYLVGMPYYNLERWEYEKWDGKVVCAKCACEINKSFHYLFYLSKTFIQDCPLSYNGKKYKRHIDFSNVKKAVQSDDYREKEYALNELRMRAYLEGFDIVFDHYHKKGTDYETSDNGYGTYYFTTFSVRGSFAKMKTQRLTINNNY